MKSSMKTYFANVVLSNKVSNTKFHRIYKEESLFGSVFFVYLDSVRASAAKLRRAHSFIQGKCIENRHVRDSDQIGTRIQL